MIMRQLADPANIITSVGIVLSITGVFLAIGGRPGLGVAVVLWALLADHLDGVVAARTRNRSPETGRVGKSLDSLADLVSAGVFPAVVVITISGQAWWSLVAAAVLVAMSALRLSYFNAFGLSGGRFVGVPTTYVIPSLAVLFLIQPHAPGIDFSMLLCAALLVLAVLHVTPVRVPRTSGIMYGAVTVFAVSASVLLAMDAT